jgi:acetyl/propionyl-CoA carboxylase alpha subunit
MGTPWRMGALTMARHEGVLTLRDSNGVEHRVELRDAGTVTVDGHAIATVPLGRGEVRVGDQLAWVASDGDLRWVCIAGRIYTFEEGAAGGAASARSRGHYGGGLSAPMPATVVKILVSPGDRVRAGDVLLILEAMKMELPVHATADGVVASIACRTGELVQPGQDLLEITP